MFSWKLCVYAFAHERRAMAIPFMCVISFFFCALDTIWWQCSAPTLSVWVVFNLVLAYKSNQAQIIIYTHILKWQERTERLGNAWKRWNECTEKPLDLNHLSVVHQTKLHMWCIRLRMNVYVYVLTWIIRSDSQSTMLSLRLSLKLNL